MKRILEELAEANPDALLAEGLESALVGYTINTNFPHVAVYDAEKCVEAMIAKGCVSRDEAMEYLEFNTFCAYVGPNGPLYIRSVE